jgi:hypothetical protein
MVLRASQSAGTGTTRGLQGYSLGTGSPRSSSSLAERGRAGSPRVSSRHRLTMRRYGRVIERKKAP